MSKEALEALTRKVDATNEAIAHLGKTMALLYPLLEGMKTQLGDLRKLSGLQEKVQEPWYPTDKAIIDYMEVFGCTWEEASIKLKEEHEQL